MLFDLRGSGRRTTVKVVYLFLAVLMGGGLILFGIGGSVSGGLVDAITGSSPSSDSNVDAYRKRAREAEATARANPKDAAAWATAARARYQLASAPGEFFDPTQRTFTTLGKEQLRLSTAAWEKHLALDPKPPDDSVAGMMVQAYSEFGLNEPAKAVDGPGDHHRGTPESRDLRHARDPVLPGRPDPQGRPREQAGALARRRGRPRDAEGRSRLREATEPPTAAPGRDRLANRHADARREEEVEEEAGLRRSLE